MPNYCLLWLATHFMSIGDWILLHSTVIASLPFSVPTATCVKWVLSALTFSQTVQRQLYTQLSNVIQVVVIAIKKIDGVMGP